MTIRMRTAALLLSLVIAMVGACGKNPASRSVQTGAPSSPTGPASPAGFAVTPFHVSGMVTDEEGRPLSNADVLVEYFDNVAADGRPFPPYSPKVMRARTDGSGRYEMDIQAVRSVYHVEGLTGVVGLGMTFGARELQGDVQALTSSTSTVVRNFQIDPVVDLAAGDSTTVTFRPDASLCGDDTQFDGQWGPLCRSVSVAVPADGTLTVSAVPLSVGATEVFIAPYSSFSGWTTVSYPVKAGTVQWANLGISPGFSAPRLYRVTTALR